MQLTKKKEKAPPKETGKGTDADIERALAQIKAKFGDESIMMLGAQPKVDVNAIPTGSIGVDWALGIGGLPRGRIIEVSHRYPAPNRRRSSRWGSHSHP